MLCVSYRWGGNTQDDNDGVSKQEVWEGMNQLWHSTNKLVTYTIGLNLPVSTGSIICSTVARISCYLSRHHMLIC